MTTRRTFLMSCTAMFAAVAAATPEASYGAGNPGPLAVVVSKNFPVDGISFGDLKRAYLGNPVTAGGNVLLPITYAKDTPERVGFDSSVLGMSPEQIGYYWIDRKIRGQSGPPKSVPNAATVIRVVTKVDGAIGFVRAGAITKEVKILRIDGKLPTDSGYRVSL